MRLESTPATLIRVHEREAMTIQLFDEDVFLKDTFNAIPFPTMVVDDDVRILFWNTAAKSLLSNEEVFQRRGGEVRPIREKRASNESALHVAL